MRANLKFGGSGGTPSNTRNGEKAQTVSSPNNYSYQQRENKYSAKTGSKLPKQMPKFVGDKFSKEDISKTSRNGHYKKFNGIKNSDIYGHAESQKGMQAGTLPNLSTKKTSSDYERVFNESKYMEQKFQKLDQLANQEKNKLLISLNDPMSELKVDVGNNSVKNKTDNGKFQTRPITNQTYQSAGVSNTLRVSKDFAKEKNYDRINTRYKYQNNQISEQRDPWTKDAINITNQIVRDKKKGQNTFKNAQRKSGQASKEELDYNTEENLP